MDKQLSIPGLSVPESKVTTRKLTKKQGLDALEGRILRLELELSLLKILMEKGDRSGDRT